MFLNKFKLLIIDSNYLLKNFLFLEISFNVKYEIQKTEFLAQTKKENKNFF